jgi:hypothetical protein
MYTSTELAFDHFSHNIGTGQSGARRWRVHHGGAHWRRGGGVPRGSPGEGEAVRLTDGGAQARREGAQRRRGAEEGSCSSTAEGEGSPWWDEGKGQHNSPFAPRCLLLLPLWRIDGESRRRALLCSLRPAMHQILKGDLGAQRILEAMGEGVGEWRELRLLRVRGGWKGEVLSLFFLIGVGQDEVREANTAQYRGVMFRFGGRCPRVEGMPCGICVCFRF